MTTTTNMDDWPAVEPSQDLTDWRSAEWYHELPAVPNVPNPTRTFDEELTERLHNLRKHPYNPNSQYERRVRWNDDALVKWEDISEEKWEDSSNARVDFWLPEPPLIPPPAATGDPWAFLDDSPKGSATLTYNDANGNLISIHALNLEVIENRSPIIAAAFEQSHRHSVLHLDLLSPLAALPFVRYLYTGTYGDGEAYNDVPTSLLLHSQLYFFASVFDMPDLKSQALINVLRQCEFACSSPDKPIDLCAALSFCYSRVEDNRRVIDEVIEYCIERFANHKLGQDPEFRALAFDHRPFYSDLAKACRRRGFQDESAIDIIRLPYNTELPQGYTSMEDISDNPRFQGVVHRFHDGNPFQEKAVVETAATGDLEQQTSLRQPLQIPGKASNLSLAMRTLAESLSATQHDQESSSEDEGFQLVRPALARDSSQSSTPTENEFVLVHRPKAATEGAKQHSQSLNDLIAATRTAPGSMENDDAVSSDSDWTLA